jgi:hypothetical protein
MRHGRHLRQSAENVLLEERQAWERDTLPWEPSIPIAPPPSRQRQLIHWLAGASVGIGAGAMAALLTDDPPTGVALGTALGTVIAALLFEQHRPPA